MRAVIFDLDGVLVDSEHLWDEVRRAMAADAGLSWPADATAAMQGIGTADWSAYMAEVVGVPETPELIAERVITAMAERYAARLPLMPGALAAVERMARRWPLGLASGSPRPLIDVVMTATPLGGLFRVAVASEDRCDRGLRQRTPLRSRRRALSHRHPAARVPAGAGRSETRRRRPDRVGRSQRRPGREPAAVGVITVLRPVRAAAEPNATAASSKP